MASSQEQKTGLNIAIDVTSCLASRTGVGVCVGSLARTLLASPQEEDYRLCAVSTSSGASASLRRSFSGGRIMVRYAPMRLLVPLADRFSFPTVEQLFGPADVFHAGPFFVPVGRQTAIVTTVWDLTPIRFPEFHIASNLFTVRQLARRLERARLVIVPSASTARDLAEFGIAPAEKVRVIPLAVDGVFKPGDSEAGQPLANLGIEGDFLMSVGALEPRKNLPRLLQAFRLLKDRYGIPHKLVIVGPSGWKNADVAQEVRRLNLVDAVVFTGYISSAALNALYNNAALLVYPSLYEGFGLPPLEAMTAGCPVAVARTSSLPEVVGEAGVYFDPLEVEDMIEAIFRVLHSPDLRAQLVAGGRVRSSRFSWQATAEATRRVYREAHAFQKKGDIPNFRI